MPAARTRGTTTGARAPVRGRAREEAILAAVGELIGEIGYERTTVDSIADRARASKATLYRRWAGKAELVADALKRAAEGAVPALPDTGSLRGDLLAAVDGIVDAVTGRRGPALLGLVEGVRDDATLRDLVRAQIETRTASNGPLIAARAVERGEAVITRDASPAIRVAIAHVLFTTLLEGAPPDAAAQQDLVDDLLLPLISGRPG